MMKLSSADLAHLVEGCLVSGPSDRILETFGALGDCGPDGISFFGNEAYRGDFQRTRAGAVFVRPGVRGAPEPTVLIEVADPVLAFDQVVRQYGAPEVPFRPGVHPSAILGEGVTLDPTAVCIGPYAVLGDGVTVGNGSWVGAHVTLGVGAMIGQDCRLHDRVTVREGCRLGDRVILQPGVVIGSDGYGYQFKDGRHLAIRQAGIVVLEDDVEIGANSTVDRARFGATVIGEGTKIDNLVQVGHNVVIGKHCLVVAQTGLSGSSRLGDFVTVAAQGGVAGHVKVGDGAVLGGRSGVISDLPGHQTYFGYPARPMKEWSRQQMFQKKIPKLLERIAALEARLAELESHPPISD